MRMARLVRIADARWSAFVGPGRRDSGNRVDTLVGFVELPGTFGRGDLRADAIEKFFIIDWFGQKFADAEVHAGRTSFHIVTRRQ